MVLVVALLSSILFMAGSINLAKANPYGAEMEYTALPVITVNSPANDTTLVKDNVMLNITVTKPTGWLIRWGDARQMLKSICYQLDGKIYGPFIANSYLESAFNHSINITNLEVGMHSLKVFADASGWIIELHSLWQKEVPLTASTNTIYFTVENRDKFGNVWISKAPMQTARGGLGVAVVNGRIYAIGGSIASGPYSPDITGGGFVGTNEEYDPETDMWTAKASMPTPRDYFAIAAYQSKIYCIGGAVGSTYDERSFFYSYNTTGVNEVYDTATNTWTTKKSLPFKGMKLQANAINGKIYVMQGTDMHVYDPSTDSWTSKAPMPATPLQGSGSPPVSAVTGNKLIVTGEFQTGNPLRIEQKLLIYDTETDRWSEGTSGPTIVIDGAAGATLGTNALQRVYLLGLAGGQFPAQSTNQVYDPKTDFWTTAKAMPTLRIDFGAVVIDDALYAIGGYSFTSSKQDIVTPVATNEKYIPIGYGTIQPIITIVSPKNESISSSAVPLIYILDKPVATVRYSFDGKDNVTVTGNTTISDLSDGPHNITVYAQDTFGNTGASETVAFTITSEPLPVLPVLASSAFVTVVLLVVLINLAKRKKNIRLSLDGT